MINKKLLFISIFTILFIAVFHCLALIYSLYWTYRWLDIPVHIVAGFGASLFTLWISLKIRHIDNILGYKNKALFVMLASVLVIAIFWEIFELISKSTSLREAGFWMDTTSDIINSLFGGLLAFLYFIKNKKIECPVIDKNLTHNFIVVL